MRRGFQGTVCVPLEHVAHDDDELPVAHRQIYPRRIAGSGRGPSASAPAAGAAAGDQQLASADMETWLVT